MSSISSVPRQSLSKHTELLLHTPNYFNNSGGIVICSRNKGMDGIALKVALAGCDLRGLRQLCFAPHYNLKSPFVLELVRIYNLKILISIVNIWIQGIFEIESFFSWIIFLPGQMGTHPTTRHTSHESPLLGLDKKTY